jgi:phage baseplate assembly protein V
VANARVRVTFPAHNQMTSWWLPILVPKAQNDKAYWIPDVGEQVVCLMDEHDEDGAVLGAIYSSADTAPPSMTADKWHLTMKDSASFEYDRNSHALSVNLPANATMTIVVNGVTISIDSGKNINLSGAADVRFVTQSHNDSVNAMINTYNSHTHPDPQGGNTGGPNQQMS